MIRWKRFEDVIVPVVVTRHNSRLALLTSYVVFKEQRLDKETLFAKVSRYKKLSRNDKDFITKYLKKMNSYGLVSIVRVDGSDVIIAAFLPYYVSLVAKALQNVDYDTLVEKLGVTKHAVKKWKEGKHMPSELVLKKISEVL